MNQLYRKTPESLILCPIKDIRVSATARIFSSGDNSE